MAQAAARAKKREVNNQPQGRSGSGTLKHPGPAKGNRGIVNPVKSGGIFRATKGRKK